MLYSCVAFFSNFLCTGCSFTISFQCKQQVSHATYTNNSLHGCSVQIRIHRWSLSWKVKYSLTKKGWLISDNISFSLLTCCTFFSLMMCLLSNTFTVDAIHDTVFTNGDNRAYQQLDPRFKSVRHSYH